MEQLLTVRNLRVWFDVRIGIIAGMLGREQKHVRAIDGITFNVKRGEVFCLVGESGCGKTTTGKALIRLNTPTGGNVFFDVPDEDWTRLTAAERRLREIRPPSGTVPPANGASADADWKRIRRLIRDLELLKRPPERAKTEAQRERYEKTMAFLDEREQALLKGTDPAITRVLSRDRHQLELIESEGAWFTPRRAKTLERLQKELKEARYQVVRASSLHVRKGKAERRVRRLERRVKAMQAHRGSTDPRNAARAQELRRAIDEKAKRLTDLELRRVRTEKGQLAPLLDKARQPVAAPPVTEVGELESKIAGIREKGGAALEALELRAQLDAMAVRYDLVRWGSKGRSSGPLRGRRKRYRLRMRQLRRRMQIIYQDPYESLNPKLSIYDIVSEPLLANHVATTQAEAQAAVAKSLEDVGLRPAEEYMFRYPHELSGGQRQRVGIATALVVDPDFIVADEPVSMLDASVRTEIIALLLDLKKRRNLTYLFITHDLGLAWIIADRIAVMYLGKIVEMGNAPEIIQNPRHPYTKALISVVPSPNPTVQREKTILHGERPDPIDIPPGCRFHPRCPMAVGICGWDAQEVREELEKLFPEDRKTFAAAGTVSAVETTGTFSLALRTKDPGALAPYLRKRIQAIALERPALGAIRDISEKEGSLELTLHNPVEPKLKRIIGDITVACHLVEPEEGTPAFVGPPSVPSVG